MPKTIAIIIAHQGFRDEEYWEPKVIFQEQGWIVQTFSTSKASAVSKFGKSTAIDGLLTEIEVKQFDALLLVGGPGCRTYFDDEVVHQIIWDFFEKKKWITAICSAVVILAKSGVLKGKRATVFPGDVKLLEKQGVLYTGKSVEQDGLMITASGPEAAKEFAHTIMHFLA